jgi:hypothetical protein
MYSPVDFTDEAKARKLRIGSVRAAEELRVNTLSERAGVDMSHMVFDVDYTGAGTAINSQDAREVARTYCIMSGAGRRQSFMRAWSEDSDLLEGKLHGLCVRAFARLDTYAAEPSVTEREWSFRVARYLDAIAAEQKEQQKQEQPKQPKPEKQKQEKQEPSSGDDWDSVPDWDEEEEEENTPNGASDTKSDDDETKTLNDETNSEDPSQNVTDEDEDAEDADEYADGEDEDDPIDGMDSPHCDIDFNELTEADIRRALEAAAKGGAKSWAGLPTHAMPNQIGDSVWIPLNKKEPALTVPTDNGKAARKPRAARSGRMRRPDQIFVDGGYAYRRDKPAPGGTVLVDISGSMSCTTEQIETILKAAPGATIAVYNSAHNLVVIVKDGYRVEDIPTSGAYNGLDGPALRWLAEQDGPRVWVSDNFVNAVGGSGFATAEQLYRECAEICLAAKILRVDPFDPGARRYPAGVLPVPAAFVGYEAVADALATFHRNHNR